VLRFPPLHQAAKRSVNTIIKIIDSKNPKFSYPVGKGTSMILTLQRFAHNAFENVVLKGIKKSK